MCWKPRDVSCNNSAETRQFSTYIHGVNTLQAVLLENAHVLSNNTRRNGICEVLYAAAWICGEFSQYVLQWILEIIWGYCDSYCGQNVSSCVAYMDLLCRFLVDPHETLEAMLKPRVTSLPGHIQSVYVQNIIKLYSCILVKAEEENDDETIKEVGSLLVEKLPMFVQSADLEVQERVRKSSVQMLCTCPTTLNWVWCPAVDYQEDKKLNLCAFCAGMLCAAVDEVCTEAAGERCKGWGGSRRTICWGTEPGGCQSTEEGPDSWWAELGCLD